MSLNSDTFILRFRSWNFFDLQKYLMWTPWALGVSLHTTTAFQSTNLQQEQGDIKQAL